MLDAITLRSEDGEFTEALTDNYLKLRIAGSLEANCWVEVAIEQSDGEVLLGRPSQSVVAAEIPESAQVRFLHYILGIRIALCKPARKIESRVEVGPLRYRTHLKARISRQVEKLRNAVVETAARHVTV